MFVIISGSFFGRRHSRERFRIRKAGGFTIWLDRITIKVKAFRTTANAKTYSTVFEERLCCSFTNNFTAEIVLKINRMKLGTHRLAEAECKPSTLFMLSINTYLLKESIKSLQLSKDGSRSACYRSLSIGHSSIRY